MAGTIQFHSYVGDDGMLNLQVNLGPAGTPTRRCVGNRARYGNVQLASSIQRAEGEFLGAPKAQVIRNEGMVCDDDKRRRGTAGPHKQRK